MSSIKFFKVIGEGFAPARASKSALGTLPAHALQYCEPVTTASALGWHIFCPLDVQLIWTGSDVLISMDAGLTHFHLSSIQAPVLLDQFNAAAPARIKDLLPSFVSLTNDAGIVQVWTGLFARTPEDWSISIRSPVNLQKSLLFEILEGIIETDRWFGPLFLNIRLLMTDVPISFKTTWPLAQVQPIHRSVYNDAFLDDFAVVDGFATFSDVDWRDYMRDVVERNECPNRQMGSYAVAARKRRAAERRA